MANTVLVVGSRRDPLLRATADRCRERGLAVVGVAEDDDLPVVALRSAAGRLSALAVDGEEVDLAALRWALDRSLGIALPPGEPDREYVMAEWFAAVRGLLAALPCPVTNRLRPELWHRRRLGPLDLPDAPAHADWCATDDPAALSRFAATVGLPLALLTATGRAIRLVESEDDLARTVRWLDSAPALVAAVPGGGVRRATVLASAGAAYDARGEEVEATVADQLLALAAALGLDLCGVDYAVRRSGELVPLAVDTLPLRAAGDVEDAGPLVDRLADDLARVACGLSRVAA